MSEQSVFVGGLRVSAFNRQEMALITGLLQDAEKRILSEVNLRANLVVSRSLYLDTYISCRVKDGKVAFGVFNENEKVLYTRLEGKDISMKSFRAAIEQLADQAAVDAELLEKGELVPEDKDIIKEWAKLDKKREEMIL